MTAGQVKWGKHRSTFPFHLRRPFGSITLLFAVLGFHSTAFATTVTFNADFSSRQVIASNGSVVTSGLVWVGTFVSETAAYDPSLSLLDNVYNISNSGGWYQFGVTASPDISNLGLEYNQDATHTLALDGNGRIAGSITDNTVGETQAGFFDGMVIYLWVFNAPTFEEATEFGIFRATDALTAWIFPENANGMADSITLGTTATAAPTITTVGGAGTNAGNNFGLVPEPSTFMMGALASMSLALRRKRN